MGFFFELHSFNQKLMDQFQAISGPSFGSISSRRFEIQNYGLKTRKTHQLLFILIANLAPNQRPCLNTIESVSSESISSPRRSF